MKYLIVILLFSVVAFAFPGVADAQSASFPSFVGYVNDFAGILTDTATLERELAEYEKNTTIEIVLVTLSELPPDQTLFSYGVELFEEWGIGKKGEDNGILVLIVPNGTKGNRLRIELGYGIQGYVTGAEAGRILDASLPYYDQRNYQKTAEIIIAGLKEQLVNYEPGTRVENSALDPGTIFTTIFLIVYVSLIIFPIAFAVFGGAKCPKCKSRKLECTLDKTTSYYTCTCKKCGHTFRKKRSHFVFMPVAAGGFGHGGGFGGFGGGMSGGGGAGR